MKSSSDCTERRKQQQQQQQLQRGKPATALVNASERERAEIGVESAEKVRKSSEWRLDCEVSTRNAKGIERSGILLNSNLPKSIKRRYKGRDRTAQQNETDIHRNKNSSGDEIANVNFFYNIAHVEASAYAH